MVRDGCRVLLNPALAAEIYAHKAAFLSRLVFATCLRIPRLNGQSIQLGKRYNASAKTIRDIWNRRTWRFATRHLWSLTDRCQIRSQV